MVLWMLNLNHSLEFENEGLFTQIKTHSLDFRGFLQGQKNFLAESYINRGN